MSEKKRKERIITQLLNEYIVRKRKGEDPTTEEYIKKYPDYADDIQTAFSQELDWMNKVDALSKEFETAQDQFDPERGWERFTGKLNQIETKDLSEIKKTKPVRDRKKVTDILATLIFPVPKPIRIAVPSVVVAVVALLLLLSPSEQLSDLAVIEPVPYIPIVTKAQTPEDRSFEKAMGLYSEEDYGAAIEKLTLIKEKNPNRMDAQFYLGLCFLLSGRIDEAISQLNDVVTSEDDIFLEKATWYLANAYLLKENSEMAIELFNKLVEMDGNYAWDAEEMIEKVEAFMK